MTQIAIVGLGRIGLPTALAFARAGWDVQAIDSDPAVLDAIRSGSVGYEEPQLDPAMLQRLTLHRSPEDVLSDIWVVCVPTNVEGRLDARAVRSVVDQILEGGATTIVVESTVPPGTCAELARGREVQFAHCPERAAPGQVVDDIATIPRLIGGVDPESTAAVREIYATVTDAPLVECSATEAELAKLAENASREVAIAFANEMAGVARTLDLDPLTVVELANSHPRVNILRPGLGVGGDCLPMATEFFSGASAVAAAARGLHRELPARWAAQILSLEPAPRRVAVLGTTYKPDVRYPHDPFEERPVAGLLNALRAADVEVQPWDPSVAGEVEEALHQVDLVLFGVSHQAFKRLDPTRLRALVRQARFVDPVGAVDAGRWQDAGWERCSVPPP